MRFTDLIVPFIILIIFSVAMLTKTDLFDSFCEGAKQGLKTSFDILPSLICLMTCIGILKSSGCLDFLCSIAKPITAFFGFPSECTPLIFIRPLSGSGALAVYDGLIADYGPDSFIGKVASTIMGSTETTFYTIAVYFGAIRIKKTRYAVPAALSADLTGWIIGAAVVRLLLP